MNKKHFLVCCLYLAGLIVTCPQSAKADDIDEKQKKLAARITVAAHQKMLSPQDAAELRKSMAKFNESKRELKAAHSDVLSAEDDARLDKELNAIDQAYEKKRKPRT